MSQLTVGCIVASVIGMTLGCASQTPTLSDRPIPPTVSSLSAVTGSATGDLRVMSFNIRTKTFIDLGNGWAFRKDLLVQTIRAFNPDVLGTQECQLSQARDLAEALTRYEFVGVGRNNGDTHGEMCGIFYRADKFRKLHDGHFWLSDTPDVPGSRSWGGVLPRMVTWVKLRPIYGGENFYVFNTHMSLSGRARVEAAEFLRDQMERIARDAPVVLTGDFNDGEGTPVYDVLTSRRPGGRLALVDTYRAFDRTPDRQEGTRGGFRGGRTGERIDWILATPHFTTVQAAIDRTRAGGRYPSDHFPVTAVLRFKPALATAAGAEPRG